MREIRLAPKQQAFVQALLKGATYAQAYKKAGFPGGRAMSDQVATSNGSRLLKSNADIQGAMKVMREELRERAMLEACDLIEMLQNTRRIAEAADPPQASAAVAAIMGMAKLLGIAVDRSEAHVIHHKPAPLPTAVVELTKEDWQRQFDPGYTPKAIEDFLE
jgi:phage terminase small subunit